MAAGRKESIKKMGISGVSLAELIFLYAKRKALFGK